MRLGFAKVHHKITPIGKHGRGLGLGKLPNICGSPVIYLQRPRCPLSVCIAFCVFYVLTLSSAPMQLVERFIVSALFYFVIMGSINCFCIVHSVIAVVITVKEIVFDFLILYTELSCRPIICDSARLISYCIVYTFLYERRYIVFIHLLVVQTNNLLNFYRKINHLCTII